jgi:hypothetical protein
MLLVLGASAADEHGERALLDANFHWRRRDTDAASRARRPAIGGAAANNAATAARSTTLLRMLLILRSDL